MVKLVYATIYTIKQMNSISKTIVDKRTHYIVLFLIVLTVAGLGVLTVLFSHAASPYSSTEAEKGTLANAATVIADTSASHGEDVQFGAIPSAALAIHVSNDQLVNGAGQDIRLLGVDVTGTEDACIQDKGFSWGASNSAEATAIASWHANAVRVPLNEDCWLGINGAPAAYSGLNYQTYIKNWVTALNQAGMYAILDLHWSAPGTYPANQQWPMPDEDHTPTFWSQVATTFKSDPAVIYDPFNEPHIGNGDPTATDWACWRNGCNDTFASTVNGVANAPVTYTTAGMQQLVTTIRAAGANQPIMAGGLNWAGDPCGTKDDDGNGGVCMETANMPTDPDHQLAISFHTYSWTACKTTSCWNTTVQGAKAANLPLITGELGEIDCSDAFMNTYMNWADQNNVSYLAWSWEVGYPPDQACISGLNTAGSGNNFFLLSKADGTPSTSIPEGANYKAHLAQINP
jgi:hypothetical protein